VVAKTFFMRFLLFLVQCSVLQCRDALRVSALAASSTWLNVTLNPPARCSMKGNEHTQFGLRPRAQQML
jgi:hypothetical protein